MLLLNFVYVLLLVIWMVAMKKTQTFRDNGVAYLNLTSIRPSARNLEKSHLGGVIFGCTKATMKECLAEQLFGLPAQHFSYVKNIYPGLPLFLFNYSDKKLHGIFEAVSSGRMNINPYGWSANGLEKTQFPAQVQIRVRSKCQPLIEQQFKPIIADNYYARNHFWFELDDAQASQLIFLLERSSVALKPSVHTEKWIAFSPHLPSTDTKEGRGMLKSLAPCVELAGNLDSTSDPSDASSLYGAKEEVKLLKSIALGFEHSYLSSGKVDTRVDALLDGANQQAGAHFDVKVEDERDLIFMKLKELAHTNECQVSTLTDHADESATDLNHMNLKDCGDGDQMSSEGNNEEIHCSSSRCQSTIAELIRGMEELKAFKTEQNLKMSYLEQQLAEAEIEIQRLKNCCLTSESVLDPPMRDAVENTVESLQELHLDQTESIYLVGGYDGESWLSTLDSYFPFQDETISCKPMKSVRSYASAAWLNGELYVFGGGDGSMWYSTVESYSPGNDQWISRPPLNGKKGSLAGATLDDKIFAVGGGNGVDCFSTVEMLDLGVGRWICTRSMLQKRFAVAAAKLNGVLYAIGGYDGNNYMNSAERFDPREHCWTQIASMNARRGCHSLVVLNEKLYALGGFDGSTMVPSIEVYDPRLQLWMCGNPMKHSRGYCAAGVIKESIYVIGGVQAGADIVDTVECFRENEGWQAINSKVIGKRCFMSAITLQ